VVSIKLARPPALEIRSTLRWTIVASVPALLLLAQRSPKVTRKQIQPGIGSEKAFGQALREIRQSRKISQEQLGFEAGFDRTYISLIERGINSPTIRTVVKLADVLKVPPSKIVIRMEQLLASARE
jgi:DNA-binding XRE family transcriptional regulator